MEQGSVLHKGYLATGDELNIPGGMTVNFQKKQRKYFVLMYLGESNLLLQGFKDEKSFSKRPSTGTLGRQRKSSSNPVASIRLMTSLKVHKVEMKTKKKIENVLIVVSGSHPRYFRPDNKEELDKWYSVLMNFSDENRGTKRRRKLVDLPKESEKVERSPSTIKLSVSTLQSFNDSPVLERDSGFSVTSRRASYGSDRSSSSSSGDEPNEYSPNKFLPSSLVFEADEEEQVQSPLTHSTSAPIPLPKKRNRRSTFIRNKQGLYEERPVEECTQSPRDPVESGIFENDIPTSQHGPQSPGETSDGSIDKPDSNYDRLPIRDTFWRPSDADNNNRLTVPPKMSKQRKLSQPVFGTMSRPIPEETFVETLPEHFKYRFHIGESTEQDEILNDDGSKHHYINLKISEKSSSFDVPDRASALMPGMVRSRSATLPILHHGSPKREETIKERPLPKPELHRSRDFETLTWEQSEEAQVTVQIDKEDADASLALVEIREKVWIAGWRSESKRELFGKLHVGDQLVQVNAQVVNSAELAKTFISTSCKPKITLIVRRLPHAHIINCKRVSEATPWGIECKGNEITNVRPGPAAESGLTPRATCAFSRKPCEWVCTEISNQPVKFNSAKDEMRRYLETFDLELPIIVQPKDFIHDLQKALSKLKRSSLYQVG